MVYSNLGPDYDPHGCRREQPKHHEHQEPTAEEVRRLADALAQAQLERLEKLFAGVRSATIKAGKTVNNFNFVEELCLKIIKYGPQSMMWTLMALSLVSIATEHRHRSLFSVMYNGLVTAEDALGRDDMFVPEDFIDHADDVDMDKPD